MLSCIVFPSLCILLDAKLSITITISGFIVSHTDEIISDVSIPVVPSTPGQIPLTSLVFGSTNSFAKCIKCLVISTFFITFGPKESGVTYSFPSPTTSTDLELSLPIKLFIWFESSFKILSLVSLSRYFISFISIVIYLPISFWRASAPLSFNTSTVVIAKLSNLSVITFTPSISVKLFIFLYVSTLSSAISVLKLYIKFTSLSLDYYLK